MEVIIKSGEERRINLDGCVNNGFKFYLSYPHSTNILYCLSLKIRLFIADVKVYDVCHDDLDTIETYLKNVKTVRYTSIASIQHHVFLLRLGDLFKFKMGDYMIVSLLGTYGTIKQSSIKCSISDLYDSKYHGFLSGLRTNCSLGVREISFDEKDIDFLHWRTVSDESQKIVNVVVETVSGVNIYRGGEYVAFKVGDVTNYDSVIETGNGLLGVQEKYIKGSILFGVDGCYGESSLLLFKGLK